MAYSMEHIKALISSQKLLLNKFLKTSEDIGNLNLDVEFELLNQILDNRDKQSKIIMGISQEITRLKETVSIKLFSELIIENDDILKIIINLDKKNEAKIEENKNSLESQMNKVSTKKDVINNYRMNTVYKPKIISEI